MLVWWEPARYAFFLHCCVFLLNWDWWSCICNVVSCHVWIVTSFLAGQTRMSFIFVNGVPNKISISKFPVASPSSTKSSVIICKGHTHLVSYMEWKRPICLCRGLGTLPYIDSQVLNLLLTRISCSLWRHCPLRVMYRDDWKTHSHVGIDGHVPHKLYWCVKL